MTEVVVVRMTERDKQELDTYAESQESTVAEIIRRFVREIPERKRLEANRQRKERGEGTPG